MNKVQQAEYKKRQNYIKQKKEFIEETEMNARFQKAQYETMYFSLENEKIKGEYFALVEKQNAEAEQQVEVPSTSEEVANG